MFIQRRITTALQGTLLASLVCACAQGPAEAPEAIEPEVTDAVETADVPQVEEAAAPIVETVEEAPTEVPTEVLAAAPEEPKAVPANFVAPEPLQEGEESATEAAAEQAEAAAAEIADRIVRRTGDIDPQVADLTAMTIAYFNTTDYREEFAQSFIPRTEVEPEYDPAQLEDLQEFFDLYKKDKTDKAFAKLARMHEDNPTATTWYLLGQKAQTDGRLRDAIELYEGAIDKHKKYLRAWDAVGKLSFQLATGAEDKDESGAIIELEDDPVDHYAKAERAFQEALSLGQVDEMTYGFLGLTLLTRERFLEAETAFRNALMMGGGASTRRDNWRQGLIQTFFKQRRYADAAALLGTLIEEDRSNASLWLFQGNAYIGLGDAKRAAENFQVAYQLGGADAAALLTLGDIFVNDGLGEDAVDRYLAAIEKDPSKAARPLKGARNLLRRQQIDAVSRLVDGVETIAGASLDTETRSEVRRLQSQVAVRRGDSETQVRILREVIDEDPLDGDALILLGEALGGGARELRELDAAATSAHKLAVAEAAEKGEPAPDAPADTERQKERRYEIEEAYQTFETAAAIEGFEASAKLAHAKVLVSQKRYDEAVPLLKSSLEYQEKENVRRFLEGVEQAAQRSRK